MAEPMEAEIVVEPDDAPFSTPKRPIQATKPTIKIRATTRQEEGTVQEPKRTTRNTTRPTSIEGTTERTSEIRQSNGGSGSSGSSDGRAMLQKALELLGESRKDLKMDKTTKQMNEELKQSCKELKLVCKQLELIATNANSPPMLYADAARSALSS
ncbi:hypothetical protein LY78DRAFT_708556 [Colletotrichum sublineola]|nr:hypothetical protein LY78DRAFT_708556 [Colletotrichum sublineola]